MEVVACPWLGNTAHSSSQEMALGWEWKSSQRTRKPHSPGQMQPATCFSKVLLQQWPCSSVYRLFTETPCSYVYRLFTETLRVKWHSYMALTKKQYHKLKLFASWPFLDKSLPREHKMYCSQLSMESKQGTQGWSLHSLSLPRHCNVWLNNFIDLASTKL